MGSATGRLDTGVRVHTGLEQMLKQKQASEMLELIKKTARTHDDLVDSYRLNYPAMILDDLWDIDWRPIPADQLIYHDYRALFVAALKKGGLTAPEHARSTRGWSRFMLRAMKRARSNSAQDIHWRPLVQAYDDAQLAKRVAAQLENLK